MKRAGMEWTALRLAVASIGWFVIAFGPLESSSEGQESVWVTNPDAHVFLLLLLLLMLGIALAASIPTKRAHLVLWAGSAVLLALGFALSVAAFLLLPFGIALVLMRALEPKRVAVAAA